MAIMSLTNSGYICSVIFSLFASSRARSKGILLKLDSPRPRISYADHIPDAFQTHWSDLNNMTDLL